MKRLVDLDDLLHYLLNVTEVDIGDDYYREDFNKSLIKEFENYYTSVTSQVQICFVNSMREPTKEENESVNNYIESISHDMVEEEIWNKNTNR